MLFTSWPFACFVAAVAAVYYAPPMRRWQLPWLVAASVALYAWLVGAMLLVLIACGALTTLTSWRVARAASARGRRAWAVLGVVGNLAALATFKYARMLGGALPADSVLAALITLPIPAGISFYSFHGISLVVDVWRGTWRLPADGQSHTAATALYLVFFPQLVAGPIMRARAFLPQVAPRAASDIAWPVVARALITGAFLKLVVADHLAVLTAELDAPWIRSLAGANIVGLVFAYAMQLFADFAGYSSLAIGLAALFGFSLPRNFNFPYLSESISEFWRRWHISLGAFLREYVYIPLGGNRRRGARNAANLLLTMTLAGLWHGAAWGYAVWGFWSGLGMVAERAAGLDRRRSRSRTERAARRGFVFAFICIGWLFFRLRDIGSAFALAGAAVVHGGWMPNVFSLAVIAWFSLPVLLYHAWGVLDVSRPALARRLVMPLLGLLLAWSFLDAATPAPFIYFQF